VKVEVLPAARWAEDVAGRIAGALPQQGAVVITGGDAVRPVYERLAKDPAPWQQLDIYFSDERVVAPEDPASNYGMARRLLLDDVGPRSVHRMRGEDPPEDAAASYAREVSDPVRGGFGLTILGLGPDAHIAALFPGSEGLGGTDRLCIAVDRPDGRGGITLTGPSLLATRRILLPVRGADKASAVARMVAGDEPPDECPARILAAHADVTLLLDEPAASDLIE
jgi:6-phosphogluconolactonase